MSFGSSRSKAAGALPETPCFEASQFLPLAFSTWTALLIFQHSIPQRAHAIIWASMNGVSGPHSIGTQNYPYLILNVLEHMCKTCCNVAYASGFWVSESTTEHLAKQMPNHTAQHWLCRYMPGYQYSNRICELALDLQLTKHFPCWVMVLLSFFIIMVITVESNSDELL